MSRWACWHPLQSLLVTGLQIMITVAATSWQENVCTCLNVVLPDNSRASSMLVAPWWPALVYMPSKTPATLLLATCQSTGGCTHQPAAQWAHAEHKSILSMSHTAVSGASGCLRRQRHEHLPGRIRRRAQQWHSTAHGPAVPALPALVSGGGMFSGLIKALLHAAWPS